MKLLKLKDVIAMTSLSKASVYRQMKDGKFPASVKMAQDLLLGLALK
ncbi:AlpA family phage regulatory protein [Aeromonas veronii]